jgi:hypothetical protein
VAPALSHSDSAEDARGLIDVLVNNARIQATARACLAALTTMETTP